VFAALDEAQVKSILQRLKNDDFEAIAISLIWSIVNPVHELRIGELISETLPDVPFTLSHRLLPIMREYRRASATAIDASSEAADAESFERNGARS